MWMSPFTAGTAACADAIEIADTPDKQRRNELGTATTRRSDRTWSPLRDGLTQVDRTLAASLEMRVNQS
jgi:hypothetical protein